MGSKETYTSKGEELSLLERDSRTLERMMLSDTSADPLSPEAGRISRKKSGDIDFLWTKDPELLLEYLKIRQDSYRDYLGLTHFPGLLDGIDLRGDILLAVKNGQCIGGARVVANDPMLETLLPLEEDGFELRELFPEFNLDHNRYGEYSRLAFRPEYRDGRHAIKLYSHLNQRSLSYGLKYVFAIAPATQARKYRQVYKHYFGLNITIKEDIKVPYKPIYKDLGKICLSVLELQPTKEQMPVF